MFQKLDIWHRQTKYRSWGWTGACACYIWRQHKCWATSWIANSIQSIFHIVCCIKKP